MKKLLIFIMAISCQLLVISYNTSAQCPDCHFGRNMIPRSYIHRVLSADSVDTLNQVYVAQNVCGLNYAQVTVLTETRTHATNMDTLGHGFPATLNMTGLPFGSCSNIQKAYMYYGVSYSEPIPPPSTITITNPASAVTTITATLEGDAGPVCWGETGTATYRADVTSLVNGNGNYTVNINGFSNPAWEIDGVTLFVVYTNPSASYSGSLIINDGDISIDVNNNISFTTSNFSVCSGATNATAFTMLGDVQADVSGGVNTETYNGSTITFPNLFWQYCGIPVGLSNLQSTLTYNTYTNDSGDCYFVGVAGLYWQNTTCVTCIPITSTLTLTTTSNPATCGNNGSASLTVAGSAGPLTYSWSPGGETTDTATLLAPGAYVVNVSDGINCSSDTVTVANNGIILTMSSSAQHCNNLGSVAVAAAGGFSPYTYSWNDGGTTSSISVTAGSYTVTVTDNSGCTLQGSVSVSSSDNLAILLNGTDPVLCPATGGSIASTVSSGIVPYTYLWSPGGQTTANLSGLSAGSYELTVTDSNGCSKQDSITLIAKSSNITVAITNTGYYCIGDSGTATALPSGGSGAYTYSWAPGGQTNQGITGLSVGSYTVLVTDSLGCSQSGAVAVTSASILFTINGIPGTIQVGDSSSLSTYCSVTATYSWAPVAYVTMPTSPSTEATPTVTTTYTCTATTACGVYTDTVTIFVTCANNYNEQICIVTIDTATDRDEIIWGRSSSPPDGSYNVYKENSSYAFSLLVNQPLTNLSEYIDTSSRPWIAASTYELATVDSCGQSALSSRHTSVFLTDTAETGVNILNWTGYVGFTPSIYRIFRGTHLNNMIQIDSVPGTVFMFHDTLPPSPAIYMIEAVNPSGSCIPTARIRPHTLNTNDEISISMSNCRKLKNPTSIQNIGSGISNLNIYPNPSNGLFTLSYTLSGNSNVVLDLVDELGQIVFSKTEAKTAGHYNEQLDLNNLASGIYSLRMQTSGGTMVKKVIVIKNK